MTATERAFQAFMGFSFAVAGWLGAGYFWELADERKPLLLWAWALMAIGCLVVSLSGLGFIWMSIEGRAFWKEGQQK